MNCKIHLFNHLQQSSKWIKCVHRFYSDLRRREISKWNRYIAGAKSRWYAYQSSLLIYTQPLDFLVSLPPVRRAERKEASYLTQIGCRLSGFWTKTNLMQPGRAGYPTMEEITPNIKVLHLLHHWTIYECLQYVCKLLSLIGKLVSNPEQVEGHTKSIPTISGKTWAEVNIECWIN